MRKIILLILCINCGMLSQALDRVYFGQFYPFQEGDKWGLIVNDEVSLIPSFDYIECVQPFVSFTRQERPLFIFSENGKQGILNSEQILVPAIYDKITFCKYYNPVFIYEVNGEKGASYVYPVSEYLTPDNKVVQDLSKQVIIPLGKYIDICFQNGIIIYLTNENTIGLIDPDINSDITNLYDAKKLGGNIKKIIDGKLDFSQLKIKKYLSEIKNDLKKIYKKHPELIKFNTENLKYIKPSFYIPEQDIIDNISVANQSGVITSQGFITIPIQYCSIEEVLERDPSNLVALTEQLEKDIDNNRVYRPNSWAITSDERFEESKRYYNELCKYYDIYVPAWAALKKIADNNSGARKKTVDYINERYNMFSEGQREALSEASRYNSVSRITNAMTGLANSFNQIASNMSSNRANSSNFQSAYKYSTNKDTNLNTKNGTNWLSEQTSYNRDKQTYSRYDSNLSSHFAGNSTMTIQSVKSAQKSMKNLREKWVSKGKDFPHSPNEDK